MGFRSKTKKFITLWLNPKCVICKGYRFAGKQVDVTFVLTDTLCRYHRRLVSKKST